jgi:hypothetical protein
LIGVWPVFENGAGEMAARMVWTDLLPHFHPSPVHQRRVDMHVPLSGKLRAKNQKSSQHN